VGGGGKELPARLVPHHTLNRSTSSLENRSRIIAAAVFKITPSAKIGPIKSS